MKVEIDLAGHGVVPSVLIEGRPIPNLTDIDVSIPVDGVAEVRIGALVTERFRFTGDARLHVHATVPPGYVLRKRVVGDLTEWAAREIAGHEETQPDPLLVSALPPILRREGGCLRCGMNLWANRHDTEFANGRTISPLCEPCWAGLSPRRRLIYYDLLMEWWREDTGGVLEEYWLVREAVLEGK